jgi:hypothetical protein
VKVSESKVLGIIFVSKIKEGTKELVKLYNRVVL